MVEHAAATGTGEHSPGRERPSPRGEVLFARFASAHMPTDHDRAVFWVLAGSETTTWSVTAVAREAQISDHEADRALRRFAAAGILERLDDRGHPRQYRWRPQMSYLHHGEAPAGPLDPVCGMPVRADASYSVVDQDGHDVFFCSMPCLVQWRHEHRRQRHPK